jgi:hypothetical protein
MALTNAEKQARWRDRNMVVLTERAELIAKKLIEAMDERELRQVSALIADHLKDRPCELCNGSGLRRMKGWANCTSKKCDTSPAFPCPDCRPAEYFVASGGELRNQGRYAEAFDAAMKVMDYWSAGDTLVKWQPDPRQVRGVSLPGRWLRGVMPRAFRRFSDGVATRREDRRLPRSDRADRHRRWGRERERHHQAR